MEGNQANNSDKKKQKRQMRPHFKEYGYAEIIIENGTQLEDREMKSYLLSLVSSEMIDQILSQLDVSYWSPQYNVYAKTVKKRKMPERFLKKLKDDNLDQEEIDEVTFYRTMPATEISDLENFRNSSVVLNISKDRASIKTPIKRNTVSKTDTKGKCQRKIASFEVEDENEESEVSDEIKDLDNEVSCSLRRDDLVLEDFIVRRSVKFKKNSKSIVKNSLEKLKPKPIFLPTSERSEEERNGNDQEVSATETFSSGARLMALNSLTIPVSWRVSYSQTEPTVCEVWAGGESVMMMKTSEDKLLIKISSKQDFVPQTGRLYDICRSLEVMKISGVGVEEDTTGQVKVFPADVAHRYLLSPEAETWVDLSLMTAYSPSLQRQCDICLSPCLPLILPCGHSYCPDCWLQWLTSPEGITGSCPTPDCQILLDLTALRWLVESEVLSAVVQARLDRLELCDPHLHSCPRCGQLARRAGPEVTAIRCLCGHSYCCLCRQEDHRPASCIDLQTFQTFSEDSRRRLKNKKLETVVEVRPCPGCHQAWEKTYGCNHMSCPCGTHFCWGCGRLASLHRGGMCDSTRIPLQTRRIEYLPTEVLEIKRIELFKLFDKFHGKAGDFLPLSSKCEDEETLRAVIKYRRCFKPIMYGLLCKELTSNNLTKVRRGISGLIGLSELLHHPQARGQRLQRIRSNLRNIEPLYNLTINFQPEKQIL